MDKLKINDRVLLVSDHFGVTEHNPMAGSEFECVGTVKRVRSEQNKPVISISVKWDNGKSNGYYREHLIKQGFGNIKSIW
jgi:hypothetical protein